MSFRLPVWHTHQPVFTHRAPRSLYPWLVDQRSLTRLLSEASHNQFTVKVLDEGWQLPFANEPGAAEGLAFIRQVILYCGDRPTVYARTVIPRSSLTGKLSALTRLGNRPLGAVLFTNPMYRRLNLETAAIRPGSRLHTLAQMHTPTGKENHQQTFWGRRSIFQLYQHRLLVNEIFLHDMRDLPLPAR